MCVPIGMELSLTETIRHADPMMMIMIIIVIIIIIELRASPDRSRRWAPPLGRLRAR